MNSDRIWLENHPEREFQENLWLEVKPNGTVCYALGHAGSALEPFGKYPTIADNEHALTIAKGLQEAVRNGTDAMHWVRTLVGRIATTATVDTVHNHIRTSETEYIARLARTTPSVR